MILFGSSKNILKTVWTKQFELKHGEKDGAMNSLLQVLFLNWIHITDINDIRIIDWL